MTEIAIVCVCVCEARARNEMSCSLDGCGGAVSLTGAVALTRRSGMVGAELDLSVHGAPLAFLARPNTIALEPLLGVQGVPRVELRPRVAALCGAAAASVLEQRAADWRARGLGGGGASRGRGRGRRTHGRRSGTNHAPFLVARLACINAALPALVRDAPALFAPHRVVVRAPAQHQRRALGAEGLGARVTILELFLARRVCTKRLLAPFARNETQSLVFARLARARLADVAHGQRRAAILARALHLGQVTACPGRFTSQSRDWHGPV